MTVSRTKLIGVALVIFAATVWLYWPSVHGEFLAGDDITSYLEPSMRLNGLTWNAVKWAFTETLGDYEPLVRLSHVLDYQIWRKNPAGHHATSVVVHAFNAALVFGFLWTLLGATSLTTDERLLVALWVTAVFAIHPLQVESVAWISGRSHLLYATFGIACLWMYAARSCRWIVLSLYVGALLCKPMAISLPFAMLAIDYYPLRRHEQVGWARLLWEKAPLIALGAVVSMVTLVAKSRIDQLFPLATIPLSDRVFLAFESLTFYPWKLVWPFHLSPYYPIPSGLSLDQWPVLGAVLGVIIISALAVIERRRIPTLAAAWGAYVMMVLPVSGLMPLGSSVLAHRYVYLAMLPLLLLAGGAGVWVWRFIARAIHHERRSMAALRIALIVLLAGQLCVFAVRTRNLTPDWRNDETEQRAGLAQFPDSELLNRVLATILLGQGRAGEALKYAQRDVEVAPQLWQAHMTLGSVLSRLGRVREAIAQEEQALQTNPDSALAHYDFGLALMEFGKAPEAMEQFEQALRINSNFAEAHLNLGAELEKQGRTADAIRHYEAALQAKPDYAEAQANLGSALAAQGRVQEAITHYGEAIRIKPDFAGAYYNRAVILEQVGRAADAVTDYEEALKLKPDYARAHFNLGLALEKMSRTPEAIEHYRKALKLRPDFEAAKNALLRLGMEQ
jgi:protein O-mannosyl-transferase